MTELWLFWALGLLYLMHRTQRSWTYEMAQRLEQSHKEYIAYQTHNLHEALNVIKGKIELLRDELKD